MPYKRPFYGSKKYVPPLYGPNPSHALAPTGSFLHKDAEFFGIPLPNEKEVPPGYVPEKRKYPPLKSIINYIQKHIKIEEIILIGLIVLMLDEKVEDDLLLIILIYILLF